MKKSLVLVDWVSPSLGNQSAKFSGHMCCGSENIRFFICHKMTRSKGNVRDSLGEVHQPWVTNMSSLAALGLMIRE